MHKIGVHPLINFSLSKWHFINSSNICHICKICLGTHLIKRRDNIWSLALHSWGIKTVYTAIVKNFPTQHVYVSLSYIPLTKRWTPARVVHLGLFNDREGLAMTWMRIRNQRILISFIPRMFDVENSRSV